ncbi:hypothetical protein BH10PLA2_BH10PLA2_20380 [soil metagenome]
MVIDSAIVRTIKANFAETPSAELVHMLQVRDMSKWSEEAMAAAQEVLDDRTQGRAFEPQPKLPFNGEVVEVSQGEPKQRLGCLTAWLVLMVLANVIFLVRMPLTLSAIQASNPSFPHWVIWPNIILTALNIVFAIALLNWKKWGFFGVLATSLVAVTLHLYVLSHLDLETRFPRSVVNSVSAFAAGPLVGLLILFVLLKLGGKESGWSQLE